MYHSIPEFYISAMFRADLQAPWTSPVRRICTNLLLNNYTFLYYTTDVSWNPVPDAKKSCSEQAQTLKKGEGAFMEYEIPFQAPTALFKGYEQL